MKTRKGSCKECGYCCSSLSITAVYSHSIHEHRSYEELKKYYQYRNIEVIGFNLEKDQLYLEVPITCQHLDNNNRCAIHEDEDKLPLLCQLYPQDEPENKDCGFYFEDNKGMI